MAVGVGFVVDKRFKKVGWVKKKKVLLVGFLESRIWFGLVVFAVSENKCFRGL